MDKMVALRQLTFTPSLFFKYATCPHWIWHDMFGDPAKKAEASEFAEKLLEQGVLHEAAYMKGVACVEVVEQEPGDAVAQTLQLMRDGAECIYQGEIQFKADGVMYRGRPDLLEKRRGIRSNFGDYAYAPVDIKSSKEIKKEQWMQLTLYAQILEKVQGVFPEESAIINRDHERIPFVVTEQHREKTMVRVEEILHVMKGNKPPFRLTSSCKNSPWYKECVHDAEEANDIALVYRLDSRAHPALREAGIRTVQDMAAMQLERLPEIPHASIETLMRAKLQAQSLMSKELRWMATPALPVCSLNIYFDIEGDPLLDVQYLWGFWVVGDAEGKYAQIGEVRRQDDGAYFVYFLAERPEDEPEMWRKFLAWLELLPKDDVAVWHYNRYERVQCEALAKTYGGSESLMQFMWHFVDLEVVVRDSVIFPLYFYSIKDIAKSTFLNFTWRHAKAGGGQSIFWYEEWLAKNDRSILNDIVNYNEDDVRATACLHGWIKSHVNK